MDQSLPIRAVAIHVTIRGSAEFDFRGKINGKVREPPFVICNWVIGSLSYQVSPQIGVCIKILLTIKMVLPSYKSIEIKGHESISISILKKQSSMYFWSRFLNEG